MPKADTMRMSSAVAYAQEGLFSKACHILTSSGIAQNNITVFELLKSKHPYSDPPITSAMSTAPAIHVPPDFSISTILRSFPKANACGYALVCHSGGDIVTRHSCLCDCIADFCHRACLAPELERGCGLTSTKDISHPADVLIPNWSLSYLAVFDLKVINPLNSNFLLCMYCV